MKRLSCILMAGAFLSAGMSCQAGIVLSVDPNTTSTQVGDTVVAAVDISGLNADYTDDNGVGPALGAFDIVFTFNPLVLGLDGITFGDPTLGDQLALTTPSFTCLEVACGAAANFPVEFAEFSLDPDTTLVAQQAPAFTLATFTFTATANGQSKLALSNVILGDQDGNAMSPDQTLNSGVNVGAQIASTPEPDSGILTSMVLGLFALWGFRRFVQARP